MGFRYFVPGTGKLSNIKISLILYLYWISSTSCCQKLLNSLVLWVCVFFCLFQQLLISCILWSIIRCIHVRNYFFFIIWYFIIVKCISHEEVPNLGWSLPCIISSITYCVYVTFSIVWLLAYYYFCTEHLYKLWVFSFRGMQSTNL